MSVGTCVDCDKTVEIDEQGNCAECGSNSTMNPQFNRLLNSSPKTLPIPSLIDKTNELFELLNKSEDFQDSKAVTPALLLAHIRMARMGNLSLGQFLENAISLWSVEAAIEESESSKEKKH